METQNQIKRRLSQPEAIEHIRNLLNISNGIRRTALANKLCEQFGFFDPLGHKQRAGCLKALRELEKSGLFVLQFYQSTVKFSAKEARDGLKLRCMKHKGFPVRSAKLVDYASFL